MIEPIRVPNLNILNALKNHTDGEVAFLEDEERYMIFKDGEWLPIEATVDKDAGLKMKLYELNKTAISQLPDISPAEAGKAKFYFERWVKETNNIFYMLYGKEIGYFTLFQKTNRNQEFKSLFDGVLECLSDLGTIKIFNAEPDENGTLDGVEIWVALQSGEVTALYFFPYDRGVVTYEH